MRSDADDVQSASVAETAEHLRQMIMGFRVTQMIHVAARLGLADLIQEGPQQTSALAAKVGADPDALYRLMRALASLNIFAETEEEGFKLTPLAELLRRDAAGSLRDVAILYGEEWLWQAYGQMLHSVRHGEAAFRHAHGQEFFSYLDVHPEAARVFHAAMSGFTGLEISAILEAYAFPARGSFVDLGGGHGAFIAALLHAGPNRRGLVFDLAQAVEVARQRLTEAGLEGRSQAVAGDFFAAVPDGHDIYILKRVIHDWNDEDVLQIFRNCRRAMRAHARLLVIERVVPIGNAPSEGKLFDINMMVVIGGKERTEREYAELFAKTGFALGRIVTTSALISVIEAVPS